MSNNSDLMQQEEHAPNVDSVIPKRHLQAPHAVDGESTRRTWAREEVLRLVQQIFLVQTKEPPRVVVFAGIDHQSGCSHICTSVAETLAKDAGRSVCLVEANFRSPGERFGKPYSPGLTDSLLSNEPINTFLRPKMNDEFCLLSSGTIAVDSANLLTSESLGIRLRELRAAFDFVIVDAPPLTLYSDAVVLGQLSDGLVLVLEADATRRESAAVAMANLRSANVLVLAAILNKRSFPIPKKIYGWL